MQRQKREQREADNALLITHGYEPQNLSKTQRRILRATGELVAKDRRFSRNHMAAICNGRASIDGAILTTTEGHLDKRAKTYNQALGHKAPSTIKTRQTSGKHPFSRLGVKGSSVTSRQMTPEELSARNIVLPPSS